MGSKELYEVLVNVFAEENYRTYHVHACGFEAAMQAVKEQKLNELEAGSWDFQRVERTPTDGVIV